MKHKVQNLIDAGWLTFEEADGGKEGVKASSSSVNAIEEGKTNQKEKCLEEVRMPRKFIWRELCKVGHLVQNSAENESCPLHPGLHHDIEICTEFNDLLNKMISEGLIHFMARMTEEAEVMMQSDGPMGPPRKPLVIKFTKKSYVAPPACINPVILKVPSPFQYTDSKAVP